MRTMIRVVIAGLLLSCVPSCVAPDDARTSQVDQFGGNKDETSQTITITITDKVPQLPDCYNLGKTCKWDMGITIKRYHAYIWGTGTWETDWTYEISVTFTAYDCDGKKQGSYTGSFPETKEDPKSMLQVIVNMLKKRTGFWVDATLGVGTDTCTLDKATAEQHFWMLFDYFLDLLKRSKDLVKFDTSAGTTLPDDDLAHAVAQGFRYLGLALDGQSSTLQSTVDPTMADSTTVTTDPTSVDTSGALITDTSTTTTTDTTDVIPPEAQLAADWLSTSLYIFDGVPVMTEPVASYTEVSTGPLPVAACACAAVQ